MSDHQVFRECPNCGQEFFRSVIDVESATSIALSCTACEKLYVVPNTLQQRNLLTYRRKQFVREDKLISLSDLGIGDVFAYVSDFLGNPYHHSLLCFDINRRQEIIRTIELVNVDWEARIVKRELSYRQMSMSGKNFIVFRYMPLDCLPLNTTRNRALEAAEPGQWPSRYDTYDNNCQHFTGYCKVADRRSKDAEKYKKKDPGHFLKGTYETSMQLSGFSKNASERGSGFLSGLSAPSTKFSKTASGWSNESVYAVSAHSEGWSSSSLHSCKWSSKVIPGLVSEWGPVGLEWSSQNIGSSTFIGSL